MSDTTRKLIVPGEPIGQPRHRVATRGGFAQMYVPKSHPVHGFKDAIRLAHGPRAPIDGPITVMVWAYFSRPKTMVWKRKPMPAMPHTSKPDIDNVVKAIFDALTGWAWHDDTQVTHLLAMKRVVSGYQEARCEIEIQGE